MLAARDVVLGSLLVLPALALAAPPPDAGAPVDPLRFEATVDSTVSPCADFYQYACGPWLKTHPMPADRSAWDPYYELAQKNADTVRGILEGREPGTGEAYRKITDSYAACLDEAAIEKKGLAPLRPELDRLAHTTTPVQSVKALASVQSLGAEALFVLFPLADFDDATRTIANLDLAGLGMSDRDYFLKDDAESVKLREAYRLHVAKMLELSGVPAEGAKAGADGVLRFETELAKVAPTRVQRRDPAAFHHPMTRAQLEALTPGFPWTEYFAAAGAPPITTLNVRWPDALKAATRLWLALSAAERHAYLRYHLVNELADLLPAALVAEDFHFYGSLMHGTKEPPPRWKRCAKLTNLHLGEAVGQVFAAAHFTKSTRDRVTAQLAAIEAALKDDLTSLSWMSDTTRAEALKKLAVYQLKVGHPDVWRDYSSLVVRRDDALGNFLRGERFERARRLAKIGTSVDRAEWFSRPQDVDGYHSAARVEVVFTAGLLQPPFFDPAMDDAVNFGAVGRAMGHEFTHGFDDEGRKFDEHGNLRDWWTKEDAAKFVKRGQCFVDEYSRFVVVDGKTLDGRLTLGENLADNGGIRLAFAALQKSLAGKPRKPLDGFTPEQRFFLAFAHTQCGVVADATAKNRLLTDPHSPGQWRVNGTVQNFEEFQKAFSCKASDPMVSQKPCRVW